MNVQNIGPIALSLGIGALVLAVMVMVLAGFIPSTYQTSLTNTTFATNFTQLDSNKGWVEVVGVYNTTNSTAGFKLPATNYTINGTYYLNITDIATMNIAQTHMVLFNVKAVSNSTNVVTKMVIALGTLADWYPIIIIVICAVIVITLIMYFGKDVHSSA